MVGCSRPLNIWQRCHKIKKRKKSSNFNLYHSSRDEAEGNRCPNKSETQFQSSWGKRAFCWRISSHATPFPTQQSLKFGSRFVFSIEIIFKCLQIVPLNVRYRPFLLCWQKYYAPREAMWDKMPSRRRQTCENFSELFPRILMERVPTEASYRNPLVAQEMHAFVFISKLKLTWGWLTADIQKFSISISLK